MDTTLDMMREDAAKFLEKYSGRLVTPELISEIQSSLNLHLFAFKYSHGGWILNMEFQFPENKISELSSILNELKFEIV